jgi:hypothetical protein
MVLALQAACGESSTKPDAEPDPEPPTAIVVTPAVAASGKQGVTTFRAADEVNAPLTGVTWRVNDVAGGSATLGTVSPTGVYTAPPFIPEGDSVVISAVLQADQTKRAASTVFFIPDNTSRDYFVALPRVVDAAHPTPTRFLVRPLATATTVNFVGYAGGQVVTGGPTVPLTPIGAGVFTFTLDARTSTDRYVIGTLNNHVGALEQLGASGQRVGGWIVRTNVRDAGMPDALISPLAPDAQRSAYVLNLRVDTAITTATSAVVARALQLLGDRFDFLVVIPPVLGAGIDSYHSVRNDVGGIGAAAFDNGAMWGVTPGGRLRGVIDAPADILFDGAGHKMIHEIGHAWINYATDAVLKPGGPHWPLSTMALGVMGRNFSGSTAGVSFPWAITSRGDGTARITSTTPSDLYTPLDLYVMGLLSSDSVPPVLVLPPDTEPSSLVDGMVLPVTTYTIGDYIAAMGTRTPSSATAQRQFAAACVVLTYGRLMTATEMAFFDAACARAETKTPVPWLNGATVTTVPGFYLATGGRATLTTRLP